MATVVGSAFLGVAVTPVGKRVFLFIITTIPNAMLCMTTTAATVQKAAFGRSISPPLAVKKHLIVSPSLTLPKGREFVLLVFEEVVAHTFPLGKAGMGPSFGLFSFPVGKVRMVPMVDGTHPWQLLQSCCCLRSVPKKPLSGSLQRERIEPISPNLRHGV